jgi:hypothetical protein
MYKTRVPSIHVRHIGMPQTRLITSHKRDERSDSLIVHNCNLSTSLKMTWQVTGNIDTYLVASAAARISDCSQTVGSQGLMSHKKLAHHVFFVTDSDLSSRDLFNRFTIFSLGSRQPPHLPDPNHHMHTRDKVSRHL